MSGLGEPPVVLILVSRVEDDARGRANESAGHEPSPASSELPERDRSSVGE